MGETDIIICLQKKNKKNIKKVIVRLKNIVHRCRCDKKVHFKIAIAKIFFTCSFINF